MSRIPAIYLARRTWTTRNPSCEPDASHGYDLLRNRPARANSLVDLARFDAREGEPRRASTIVDSIICKLPLTARTAFQARDRLRHFREDLRTIEPLLLERW